MLGNEVANIISSGVLSVLGALASYGVTIGVTYLKKKREALINQLGVDQYNKDYKIAQDIYYIVEQQFKFIPQAGEQKKQEFDKLLVEKYLEYLRKNWTISEKLFVERLMQELYLVGF